MQPKFVSFNDLDSPIPSNDWVSLSQEDKFSKLKNSLVKNKLESQFKIVRADESGGIFVELLTSPGTSKRGAALLDLEEIFKNEIDFGLTIWCEPLGDKNALRKLRGIQIKSGENF
jgi:hypothetical protein